MKKLLLCILAGALVLSMMGCAAVSAYADEPAEHAKPTEPVIPATAPAEPAVTRAQYRLLNPDAGNFMSFGFPDGLRADDPIDYSGGEISIPLEIETNGYRRGGLGILLFLDGQPQPYRTEEEPNYAYMHTVYPQENTTTVLCSLIPVTGEKGQTLRLNAMYISEPGYFLDQGIPIWRHTDLSGNAACQIDLEEAPAASELPPIRDRILSTEICTRELYPGEAGSLSERQMQEKIFTKFILQHDFHAESMNHTMQQAYGVSNTHDFTFHAELFGNPAGVYDLVLFADNVPISCDPEKQLRFQTENGKMTVIDVQLDLSDFDGSSVIYGFLIAQNFDTGNSGAAISYQALRPVYLSGAESLEDLMGWDPE